MEILSGNVKLALQLAIQARRVALQSSGKPDDGMIGQWQEAVRTLDSGGELKIIPYIE